MNDSPITPQIGDLLNPNNALLTNEEAEIVKTLSTLVVLHDRLIRAQEVVRNAIAENKAQGEPRHTLVLGDAGCGKTTLLNAIQQKLPPVDDTFTLGVKRKQPLLKVSLPGSITTRSVALHMLRAVGDTSSLHGTCFDLTERLKQYIETCEVELIWLDEFQHMLALGSGTRRGASKRLSEACNWIKGIINDTKVSFVLMGTMETMAIIDHDSQIERRFTHLATLEAFPMPTSGSSEMVTFVDQLMLEAVEELRFFDTAEWLEDRPIDATRLWVATEGVPSRIKDLLIRACLNAKRRDSRVIAMVDFTAAFQDTRKKRMDFEVARARKAKRKTLMQALELQSINPFAANDDVINTLARKMAA